MIEKNMLYEDAWKQLSHSEMIAYIYLKANYNGSNNGEIPFRYSSMKGVMSPATLSKALKRLQGERVDCKDRAWRVMSVLLPLPANWKIRCHSQ